MMCESSTRMKYVGMTRMTISMFIVFLSCLFLASEAYNSRLRFPLRSARMVEVLKVNVNGNNNMILNSGSHSFRFGGHRMQCKEKDNESEGTVEAEAEAASGQKQEDGGEKNSDRSREATQEVEVEVEEEEGEGENDKGDESDTEKKEEENEEEENEEEELSPEAKAIKEAEEALRKQLNEVENTLRSERVNLSKVKDKKDLSGKNGFYIIQARVNEWNKQKDVQQKRRISANKREFVLKMLPIVDAFKKVPDDIPATNEREENMHESLGKIQYVQILQAFEKFGYVEFGPEKKDAIDPVKHQVEGELVEQGTEYEGKVVEVLKKGIVDVDGNVIRRCLIIGGKPTAEREAAMKKAEEEAKAAEKLEDEEAEKFLEEEKEVEAANEGDNDNDDGNDNDDASD